MWIDYNIDYRVVFLGKQVEKVKFLPTYPWTNRLGFPTINIYISLVTSINNVTENGNKVKNDNVQSFFNFYSLLNGYLPQ